MKFVFEVFIECLDYKELSHSQTQSVITFIFKKIETKKSYYRPISSSNIDCEILASRLQNVIGKIISPDQAAYKKSRFCGQNIRLVSDVFAFTKEKTSSMEYFRTLAIIQFRCRLHQVD